MKKKIVLSIPVRRALKKLGNDLKTSRILRGITVAMMAERTNVTAVTITKIEKGNPSVSFGTYATVVFVLGMIDKLQNLLDLSEDIVGKRLMEKLRPKRVRSLKQLKPNHGES
jgi:transcriptional regulator with XRE-family HTH domain